MRVRFAPSPTGFLHIGNARTAVVNHLIAKKTGADFIIRIEDTDRERSSVESEISILEDLRWLGIEWNEGPGLDRGHGPYRQSERDEIYSRYTEKLIEGGHAFYCFCTNEIVEADKKSAMEQNRPYLDRCRDIPLEEQKKKAEEGNYPVKFGVPEGESIVFEDRIKGRVEFNSSNIGGDFIIVRSDGGPVYNYIVSIDDALMEITDVIRGEDHLSNTPKQILIAKALGIPAPTYAHLPLILGSDKKKLSKRHGITSVDLYRQEGYLPEALMNYLGMLGWSTESGEEILEFDNLVSLFDIEKIGKSAAVFDFQKLKWMNGSYMKKYSDSEIVPMFLPYLKNAGFDLNAIPSDKLQHIISITRNSCEILSDITKPAAIFLNEINVPDEATEKLLMEDYSKDIIEAAFSVINSLDKSNVVSDLIPGIKEKTEHKGKKFFHPLRAVLTGSLSGPDLDLAIPVLGYETLKKRIEYCRERFC